VFHWIGDQIETQAGLLQAQTVGDHIAHRYTASADELQRRSLTPELVAPPIRVQPLFHHTPLE
jgi:hypothetical protein